MGMQPIGLYVPTLAPATVFTNYIIYGVPVQLAQREVPQSESADIRNTSNRAVIDIVLTITTKNTVACAYLRIAYHAETLS